MPVGENLNL